MIWLIGSKGMLGQEIAKELTRNKLNYVTSDSEVDITSIDALEHYADKILTNSHGEKVDFVINCAAYTAVDKAEDEEELARKVNALGPEHIARVTRNLGAKLIHISTDYVFNGSGSTPYTEDMAKLPLGAYGRTKSEGEDAVTSQMTQYYILRTAWLYGLYGHNFVYTMTKLMNSKESLSVVSDQKGTPTNCSTLAQVVLEIINQTHKGIFVPAGIYHVTDEGETTWYEFAKAIQDCGIKAKKITGTCQVNPCTTDEYPTKAKRPAYSVLDKTKIQKTLKIKLPDWEKSLKSFFKEKDFEIK